jgi:hypothetical protein
MKGKPQLSDLGHFGSIEKPLREKKTRWLSTDCRASNLRFDNAGRLLSI